MEDADAASYCLGEFGGTVVNAIRVTGYGGGDDGSIVRLWIVSDHACGLVKDLEADFQFVGIDKHI